MRSKLSTSSAAVSRCVHRRDAEFEEAWKFLMNPNFFYAEFGPTTVERHDPLFALKSGCCWWCGQSWPFATTQTLKALANVLHHYEQEHVAREDYVHLIRRYAMTHRKDGRPYIAEAVLPDTGSWAGHDMRKAPKASAFGAFCVRCRPLSMCAAPGEQRSVY